MKLRIRSQETKQSFRLEIPDASTLSDLKSLIAAILSPPPAIPTPSSIRLSLNRSDELIAPSPSASLPSLGLTSGDLLFFSLLPQPPPPPIDPAPPPPADDAVDVAVVETLESNAGSSEPLPSADALDVAVVETLEYNAERLGNEKPPQAPSFLKRAMELENWTARGGLGCVVVAVHAVFLESGFLVSAGGTDGSRLPLDWASSVASSVRYTVPELLDRSGAKIATLKFVSMGKFVVVYGSSDGGDVYRLQLDVPELAPAVAAVSFGDVVGEEEEKEVFQLWKTVRDGLALPLLIDLCDKNGLPLPPCFTRLPTELKMKILELLPGVDIARAACAGSELRYISSNNELWKRKFEEARFGVFDGSVGAGRNWKEKFAIAWSRKMETSKRIKREGVRVFGFPNPLVPNPRHNPFAPPRIIGGDYDMFPGIGSGVRPLGPRIGFPNLPGRRNFSPRCNLSGRDSSFP